MEHRGPSRAVVIASVVVVVGLVVAPATRHHRWELTVVERPLPGAAVVDAPDDPLFRAQWALRAIGAPEAWAVSRGSGAIVAVLDTGVAYEDFGDHRRAPDLAATPFAPGWDFVGDDPHPNDEPVPGRPSHGTHVAGVIAQTSGNGIGSAGVAPEATIMPVRVLGADRQGDEATIARGLRFAADKGAHVANLSFGGPAIGAELTEAVAYAVRRGVTVVASAGEDGSDAVTFPAALSEVIAVGAVRLDNTRAPYSNYGEALDLVAPGGDLSRDQNGDDLDDGIVQQTLHGQHNTFCFCFVEGTSAAAAHVSGVAALLVASGRAATPAEVRDALLGTAKDLGAPGRDDEFGAGLVQASAAMGVGPPVDPPVAAFSERPPGGADHHAGAHDHRVVAAPVSEPQRRERDASRRPAALLALGGIVGGGVGLLAILARRGPRSRRPQPDSSADER